VASASASVVTVTGDDNMSDEQKGRAMTRTRWFYAAAAVAAVLGVWRLYMIMQVSVLSVPVSCGNAFGYLAGLDKGHPGHMAICGASLRNASVEGVVLLLVALALMIAAMRTARETGVRSMGTMRYPAAPGWYQFPGRPGRERWWDGRRWTVERPVTKEGD
jgi:hypothetical protein